MAVEMDRQPEQTSTEPRRFSRRELFKIGGRAASGAVIAPAVADLLAPRVTSAAPEEDANATQVNQLLIDTGKKYGVDAVGYRISNTWRHTDGTWLMAYQGAIVQYMPGSGQVNLWNTLDEATKLGLDARLDNGSLGVTIPPKEEFDDNSNGDLNVAFAKRNSHFQVPLGIQTWINNFRQQFETGVPISRLKNYGPYSVIRYQRLAAQIWTDGPNRGLIQRILVGDAMKAAGLIPSSALLARPDDGSGTPEPIINPEPTPEVVNAPFPREIGKLERDGVMIHNKGTRIGVVDNREDPQNNWQAVVDIARRYGGGDRFEFFFYDNPNAVPAPSGSVPYDTNINWPNSYPGAEWGKQLRVKVNGVWQWHVSIPANLRSEDFNKFSRGITGYILSFFISKDNVSTRWGSDFAAILRQHALDPFNTGKMNFTFRVVR